jgi:hypothetical protein
MIIAKPALARSVPSFRNSVFYAANSLQSVGIFPAKIAAVEGAGSRLFRGFRALIAF